MEELKQLPVVALRGMAVLPDMIPFSATSKQGRDEIWQFIEETSGVDNEKRN